MSDDLLFLPFSVPPLSIEDFNQADEVIEIRNHLFRQKALSEFLDNKLDADTFFDILEHQCINVENYLTEVTENIKLITY